MVTTPEQHIINGVNLLDPALTQSLGHPATDLDPDQQALLAVLLNPENDPYENSETLDDMLEELADFTGWDCGEDRTVAERLRQHYSTRDGWGSFEFEHTHDTSAAINGYNVMLWIDAERCYLAVGDDIKHLGGGAEGRTGVHAALHTASALAGDYERLIEKATRLGLMAAAA